VLEQELTRLRELLGDDPERLRRQRRSITSHGYGRNGMTIDLTGNLRRYVDFDFEIRLEADTVLEGLRRLSERYPAIKEVLFDGDGNVRSVHRLTLNGSVLGRDELVRATGPNDEIVILTGG
jgi:hypothetical protein